MSSIETAFLKQKSVLWSWDGTSRNRTGDPKLDAPVQIDTRWEFGRGESDERSSTTVEYEARVAVKQDITIGSILWLGKLADVATADTYYQVVDFKSSPSIKNRKTRRIAFLMKYSGTLPALA